ncbi:hypothetical protein AVEN_10697-1, partial [Araneus ventricosus]
MGADPKISDGNQMTRLALHENLQSSIPHQRSMLDLDEFNVHQ